MSTAPVKCVVWDLDDTLWRGTLVEGDDVALFDGRLEQLRQMDERGILLSLASRNDEDQALRRLRDLGVDDYFLHPQINWNAKSWSVRQVAERLNIGLDSVVFVDDQDYERAEVQHALPQVRCFTPTQVEALVELCAAGTPVVTEESRGRRRLYRSQAVRDAAEAGFAGTSEEFLAGLDLTLTVAEADAGDLGRAVELTVRTNQLNSTGRTYSYEELDRLRGDPGHRLLVASLRDRFGDYGTIGVILLECGDPDWHLRLLLVSCRVMSRGVGTILLNLVMGMAREAGRGLRADFVDTGRNRLMRIAYGFAGFVERDLPDGRSVLVNDLATIQPPPPYVRVVLDDRHPDDSRP